jgi:archaellum biogenesis ATPase FlaH
MPSECTLFDASGTPVNGHYCTLSAKAETWSASELIRLANEHPPEPVIKGLVNKGDIFLLHGSEESFKSVFILQMAESVALGTSLLMYWNVPQNWRVGVIETEIHEMMLGERLRQMFPKGNAPKGMCFMRESALHDWRRRGLRQKFESIQRWIEEEEIEVLLIDTANDFFRGEDNPSAETDVGTFFDELRSLKVGARGIVRHDRKKKAELDDQVNSNERIRGSSEWKEDPEVIVLTVAHF